MKYIKHYLPIVALLVVLSSMVVQAGQAIAPTMLRSNLPGQTVHGLSSPFNGQLTHVQKATIARTQPHNSVPVPFMHRPYYGSLTVSQRTTSFVDHDKPWYVNDGIFVRYDGARWTNASIGSCIGGVNCYDGHNGYDLNLRFEAVLSVAAGTVIRAGWYNPYDHQSALGLWVAVDHGNGYATAYGHLSALTVAVGDKVGTQWQLGTSGTTGSSTGPHLHMATYYYPNWSATDPFGWTGNYPDPNVVPDNYLWVSDSATNYTIPDLSGQGSAVYPGATLVDDGGSGWSSTGNWTSATSSTAINGALHWAPTVGAGLAPARASATATWLPRLTTDGYYEVGVFVNDTHASSSWAPYTVYSADPNQPGTEVSHNVYVDETHIGSFQGPYNWQNTGPQWVSLGTYFFRTSLPGRVVLSNATGENGAQVSADGMEFASVAEQTPSPTPTPSPIYGFSITSDGTPRAMLPNATTNVTLTLKNTSNFTWKATGTGAVQVLYSWLNNSKQVLYHGINNSKQILAAASSVALPQDVNSAASVTVTVPVQTPAQIGAYTLQWDMVQDNKLFSQYGAQVQNDAVEVARYGVVFGPAPLPTTLAPGATVQVNVNVQNKGAITWPAGGNAQVTLGYYWQDSAGHPLSAPIVGASSMGFLSADIAPGQSTSIPITLHTPFQAGSYRLIYDLQQQRIWFSSQGAMSLMLAVTITPTLPRIAPGAAVPTKSQN